MTSSKPKAILSWSSGKDSAWALHVMRQRNDFEIVALVTTINEEAQRVAMHAVRVLLLEQQAEAAGIPLWKIPLPYPCTNEAYEAILKDHLFHAKQQGISHFIFGDLFLEDIRAYREKQLAGTGISPVFPLWKQPTDRLARQMVAESLRAYVTCVDPNQLPAAFAGRIFDADFLRDLPTSVDPCGERGEFHTFAFQGPMFDRVLPVTKGEILERDGFVFADLL